MFSLLNSVFKIYEACLKVSVRRAWKWCDLNRKKYFERVRRVCATFEYKYVFPAKQTAIKCERQSSWISKEPHCTIKFPSTFQKKLSCNNIYVWILFFEITILRRTAERTNRMDQKLSLFTYYCPVRLCFRLVLLSCKMVI